MHQSHAHTHAALRRRQACAATNDEAWAKATPAIVAGTSRTPDTDQYTTIRIRSDLSTRRFRDPACQLAIAHIYIYIIRTVD